MSAAGSQSHSVPVGSVREMVELGRRLARVLRAGDSVSLEGPLGAGKTTLVRGLAEGLGVRERVSSPTFVISRRHPGSRADLVHCDAYRVPDPLAFDDLDLDRAGAVTVVEWGAPVIGVLGESWLAVTVDRGQGEVGELRNVAFHGHGTRWPAERMAELRRAVAAAGDGSR